MVQARGRIAQDRRRACGRRFGFARQYPPARDLGAWAQAQPRHEMIRRRKARHVGTDFANQGQSAPGFDTIDPEKFEGIGLKNVRRRLDLLFGKNYVLNTEERDKQYIVSLKIPV